MADTYEKDLAQKSSLTVNDFIRVVGTDNVSYKQLVSDVAKKIIENYIGSSLAGSSQSVKSALDALNSNFKGLTVTSVRISGEKTINVPNNYRGVFFILTSNTSYCGAYFLAATGAGVVINKAIAAASSIGFSGGTNTFTITPPSGTFEMMFLNIGGSAVTV